MTSGQTLVPALPGPGGRRMETQAQKQTQEKTAPLISILLSAMINYFIITHSLCSQEMILWLFALWASNMDFKKAQT